jgi:hypothetical protein
VEGELPKPKEKKDAPKVDLGWMGALGKIFIYFFLVLVFIFLAYLIYRFFSGQSLMGNPKLEPQAKLEFEWQEIEDRLLETELDKYLREALERKDFRMAVRVYFLMAIKSMSEKGFIQWSRNKTNMDYLYETAQLFFNHDFKRATSIYESVWYGKQPVDEQSFQGLSVSFGRFLQNIRQA